jgi:hypothetical protein
VSGRRRLTVGRRVRAAAAGRVSAEPNLSDDAAFQLVMDGAAGATDAVAVAGWTGAINVTGAAKVSAVLRSREATLGAMSRRLAREHVWRLWFD